MLAALRSMAAKPPPSREKNIGLLYDSSDQGSGRVNALIDFSPFRFDPTDEQLWRGDSPVNRRGFRFIAEAQPSPRGQESPARLDLGPRATEAGSRMCEAAATRTRLWRRGTG